jgi:hypothetical protein
MALTNLKQLAYRSVGMSIKMIISMSIHAQRMGAGQVFLRMDFFLDEPCVFPVFLLIWIFHLLDQTSDIQTLALGVKPS